jgi:hypothetical protein
MVAAATVKSSYTESERHCLGIGEVTRNLADEHGEVPFLAVLKWTRRSYLEAYACHRHELPLPAAWGRGSAIGRA